MQVAELDGTQLRPSGLNFGQRLVVREFLRKPHAHERKVHWSAAQHINSDSKQSTTQSPFEVDPGSDTRPLTNGRSVLSEVKYCMRSTAVMLLSVSTDRRTVH